MTDKINKKNGFANLVELPVVTDPRGDLTFIEVESSGTATSGPKISFIFSEIILAVLKSP